MTNEEQRQTLGFRLRAFVFFVKFTSQGKMFWRLISMAVEHKH